MRLKSYVEGDASSSHRERRDIFSDREKKNKKKGEEEEEEERVKKGFSSNGEEEEEWWWRRDRSLPCVHEEIKFLLEGDCARRIAFFVSSSSSSS